MNEGKTRVKNNIWQKGYVQVYTGNGKGKTTAALGLAVRAAGAGLRVFIGQFVKGMEYSEIVALRRFEDLITVKQYGSGCYIYNRPEVADIIAAENGLDEVREVIHSGNYKVVILDEANIATYFSLFSVDKLLALIDSRPDDVELVITGRKADQRVIERADLVTEMQEVRHYYVRGVEARHGIES
jgi:cob(I)alamin adenosyltransferase